ncbi:MAG: signal peptidase I [Candidatus Nitrospinota bacterium M3_3B_026]
MKKTRRAVFETAKSVAIALALVFVLKGAAVEANQIVSSSMTPTLMEGDYIIVNKARYGLHVPFVDRMLYTWSSPERGDVVTFKPPPEAPASEGRIFVKRVVAIPGDIVEIKDSRLYINGEPVRVTAAPRAWPLVRERMGDKEYTILAHDRDYSFGPVKVPEGYVFAVGDNRDNSHDSRAWGPLPIENIQGKAEVIYFTRAGEKTLDNLERIGNLL